MNLSVWVEELFSLLNESGELAAKKHLYELARSHELGEDQIQSLRDALRLRMDAAGIATATKIRVEAREQFQDGLRELDYLCESLGRGEVLAFQAMKDKDADDPVRAAELIGEEIEAALEAIQSSRCTDLSADDMDELADRMCELIAIQAYHSHAGLPALPFLSEKSLKLIEFIVAHYNAEEVGYDALSNALKKTIEDNGIKLTLQTIQSRESLFDANSLRWQISSERYARSDELNWRELIATREEYSGLLGFMADEFPLGECQSVLENIDTKNGLLISQALAIEPLLSSGEFGHTNIKDYLNQGSFSSGDSPFRIEFEIKTVAEFDTIFSKDNGIEWMYADMSAIIRSGQPDYLVQGYYERFIELLKDSGSSGVKYLEDIERIWNNRVATRESALQDLRTILNIDKLSPEVISILHSCGLLAEWEKAPPEVFTDSQKWFVKRQSVDHLVEDAMQMEWIESIHFYVLATSYKPYPGLTYQNMFPDRLMHYWRSEASISPPQDNKATQNVHSLLNGLYKSSEVIELLAMTGSSVGLYHIINANSTLAGPIIDRELIAKAINKIGRTDSRAVYGECRKYLSSMCESDDGVSLLTDVIIEIIASEYIHDEISSLFKNIIRRGLDLFPESVYPLLAACLVKETKAQCLADNTLHHVLMKMNTSPMDLLNDAYASLDGSDMKKNEFSDSLVSRLMPEEVMQTYGLLHDSSRMDVSLLASIYKTYLNSRIEPGSPVIQVEADISDLGQLISL